MVSCSCPECKTKLEINKNDTTPGCREHEEVYCPKCSAYVTKVFTSGFPSVNIID